MATKNVGLLHDVERFSSDTSPGLHLRQGNARTRGAYFLPPMVSALREQGGSAEPDHCAHEDYKIALLPHNRKALPDSRSVELPAPTQRMLILPFTWRELSDRVRRELYPAISGPSMRARFGEVSVDFLTMEITRSEKLVVLTNQEFKLLRYFIHNPQRVLSRDELLNEVWGYNQYPSTRTVDNHVWMLRRKLELQPARPIHFITVQRNGYKFVPRRPNENPAAKRS